MKTEDIKICYSFCLRYMYMIRWFPIGSNKRLVRYPSNAFRYLKPLASLHAGEKASSASENIILPLYYIETIKTPSNAYPLATLGNLSLILKANCLKQMLELQGPWICRVQVQWRLDTLTLKKHEFVSNVFSMVYEKENFNKTTNMEVLG